MQVLDEGRKMCFMRETRKCQKGSRLKNIFINKREQDFDKTVKFSVRIKFEFFKSITNKKRFNRETNKKKQLL